MACMDHSCTNPKCNWYSCDNQRRGSCPDCGSPVTNIYDDPEPNSPDWDAVDDEEGDYDVGEADAERADECRDARRAVERGP